MACSSTFLSRQPFESGRINLAQWKILVFVYHVQELSQHSRYTCSTMNHISCSLKNIILYVKLLKFMVLIHSKAVLKIYFAVRGVSMVFSRAFRAVEVFTPYPNTKLTPTSNKRPLSN